MEPARPEGERQVQVRFVTKQARYAVTDTPINVPVTLRRYALSEIVNHLLGSETPVPFDFLIDGQFIRTTLEKHIADKGLSGETVVELEYVEALPPPSPASSFKHDDWVSAVHASQNGLICTGCYDNGVSLWSVASGECLSSARGHTAPVKTVRWVGAQESGKEMFLSGSQDCTMLAWEVSEEGAAVAARYVYKGHTASVETVAVSPDGQRFVSGSFDHTVKLWSLDGENEEDDEEASSKRQKTGSKDTARRAIPQAAYGTLTAHTNAVTGAAWADTHTVYTSSWDHTIREWDLSTGTNTYTMTGQKAINTMAWSPASNLLATAGADRAVRVWDPRQRDGAVVKLTLTSHEAMTSCVAWCSSNGNRLVSGAYDGSVKVWDVRSNVPLHTLPGHEDKTLCADWSLPEYIMSGGADNKLAVYNIQTRSEGA